IARPVEVYRVDLDNVARSRRAVSGWGRFALLVTPRRVAAGAGVGIVGVVAWSLSQFWSTSSTAPPPMSVAILPLVTDVGNASELQLADALTRDLSSAVEKDLPIVLVTSPTRAATYRDKVVDART